MNLEEGDGDLGAVPCVGYYCAITFFGRGVPTLHGVMDFVDHYFR